VMLGERESLKSAPSWQQFKHAWVKSYIRPQGIWFE
jgi:hypothetical protein